MCIWSPHHTICCMSVDPGEDTAGQRRHAVLGLVKTSVQGHQLGVQSKARQMHPPRRAGLNPQSLWHHRASRDAAICSAGQGRQAAQLPLGKTSAFIPNWVSGPPSSVGLGSVVPRDPNTVLRLRGHREGSSLETPSIQRLQVRIWLPQLKIHPSP